jgi:hypothetical protein
LHSRGQHEELEVEENVEEEAKKLKHEADHETNIEVKCTKYLQVYMTFKQICGYSLYPDPDPAFQVNPDPDTDPIRIQDFDD